MAVGVVSNPVVFGYGVEVNGIVGSVIEVYHVSVGGPFSMGFSG